MKPLRELPADVVKLIESGIVAEYATLSAAGVPIDTPTYYFPSADLATLDLATGLSYPIKAERARRNPKVGLLIEGTADEPVVSIAGHAAVRDADLQGNVIRYLSETGHTLPGDPPWSTAQKAVWYWTRMIVSVSPVRVLWWDNPAAMEGAPHRWRAPADTAYPESDPTPPGTPSAASQWPPRPWRETAEQALARKAPGHLTLCDEEGYPLPLRAHDIRIVDDGFIMTMPTGAPWAGTGPTTLSFEGLETFIGKAVTAGGETRMHVERSVPFHPLMNDPKEIWEPSPDTYANLMRRLTEETARRGQPIPTIPADKPLPTALARLRIARRDRTPPAVG